jgi:hypothetical protein
LNLSRTKLTILFSGMLAGDPGQGGATWAVLQYVLGLRRLGHEVCLVEPVSGALEGTERARYFREVAHEFGLDQAALLRAGTMETMGLSYEDIRGIARRADVLFNVSGMLTDAALIECVPRRVYLDLDPAFVQLWHAVEKIDMRLAAHTHFVTVGMNVGREGCTVPTCGENWAHTPQPVVLERWPVADAPPARDGWTTVANWRGYGSVEHGGVRYGQKAHSLRRLIDLPTRTAERFELALSIHPDEKADLAALAANRWKLVDPSEAAGTPARYAAFVRGSRGEFGLAKSGYVASNCGWFSDRSACYLASGRPVVAQETGWSSRLPAGEGLFSFRTADDVVAATAEVRRDYPKHARAARALAERYFDSDVVLASLLDRVGVGA